MKTPVIFLMLFMAIVWLYGCSQHIQDNQDSEEESERLADVSPSSLNRKQYCGPIALHIICQAYGIPAAVEELAEIAGTDSTGTTLYGLAQAARAKGFSTAGLKVDFQHLKQLSMPLIAHVEENHYVVVKMVDSSGVIIIDPAKQEKIDEYISAEEFNQIWDGVILQLILRL